MLTFDHSCQRACYPGLVDTRQYIFSIIDTRASHLTPQEIIRYHVSSPLLIPLNLSIVER